MSEPAVVFDRVWKKFRRGQRHDSLRDLIPSLVKRLTKRPAGDLGDKREFWALQDVSFAVPAGEAFGIIGPNGAGKSTTLKLLTRILKPTRGTCLARGRTGALIEVAAGFHPDLSGRENVYLQGAIMGMKRREIDRKLDAIVDFAGVAAFIDTPVKRYSSGMNARLGFSIAAHLEPDVLIIDEVLSVGDMAFQERCIQRMLEFKQRGVAIVFVSHNLQAVSMLCERALFIAGRTIATGETAHVLRAYTERAHEAGSDQDHADFVVRRSSLESAVGRTEDVPPGTSMALKVTFEARRSVPALTFSLVVRRSTDSLVAYNGNFPAAEFGITEVMAGDTVEIEFRFRCNLLRGMYQVECIAVETPTLIFLNPAVALGSFSIAEMRTWNGIAELSGTVTGTVVGRQQLAAAHRGGGPSRE